MTLGDRIRLACAEVTKRARHVRFDEAALGPLADAFTAAPPSPDADPAHQPVGPPQDTLAMLKPKFTFTDINIAAGGSQDESEYHFHQE